VDTVTDALFLERNEVMSSDLDVKLWLIAIQIKGDETGASGKKRELLRGRVRKVLWIV